MTIQQAIEKAIEGGYENPPKKLNDEFDIWENDYNAILLDPAFWQALGKSMLWDEDYYYCKSGLGCTEHEKLHSGECMWEEQQPEWLMAWHGLINALADGNSIEDYCEKL